MSLPTNPFGSGSPGKDEQIAIDRAWSTCGIIFLVIMALIIAAIIGS